jgi:hypothetical protein
MGQACGLALVMGLDLQFHVDAAHGDAAQGFLKAVAPIVGQLAQLPGLLVGQCDRDLLRHGVPPG